MSAETATVLFTDLVGSTALRTSLGEERADRLGELHDQLLGAVVEAHGGLVVKSLGDGVLATFGAASDAVTAAVEMQQSIERHNRGADAIAPLSVRIGLSTGDVTWADSGDISGSAVVEAARIQAAAGGGQILCAALVQLVSRGRGGHRFVPVGELELKGLPEPVPVCEVMWEPVTDEDDDDRPSQLALPGALRPQAALPFVGRVDELARARKVLTPDSSRGGVLWLLGEPGIGKTRLVAELAQEAHLAGRSVVLGRCQQDLAIPFRPIVEALRQVVTGSSPAALQGRLGGMAEELVRLCPELERALPEATGARTASDIEVHRLYEAVREWLAADELLVVLDDLQWATRETVQLLRYVLTESPLAASVAITVRDTELGDDLRALIDETLTSANGVVLPLTGLPPAEIRQLGEQLGISVADDELHQRTGGNPLFLQTTIVDEGSGPVSVTAAAAVERRVLALADHVRRCLRTAAVIGLDFDLATVSAAVGRPTAEVLDAVETAIDAGLVRESDPGRFEFSHGLVRDALNHEIGHTRRALVHRAVAEALEQSDPTRVSELAHHWTLAATDAPTRRIAGAHNRVAAEAAERACAHDEAARLYGQARDLLAGDTQVEVELTIAEAMARVSAGDYGTAPYELLLAAADDAHALGNIDLEAAALTEAIFTRHVAGVQDPRGLARAQRIDPSDISDLAARVRFEAVVAGSHYYAGEVDRARHHVEDVLRLADLSDDPLAQAWAHHHASLILARPESISACIRHATLAIDLRRGTGPVEHEANTRWIRAALYVRAGRLEEARADVLAQASIVAVQARPLNRHMNLVLSGLIAFLDGDLAQAESVATEAHDLAAAVEGLDGAGMYGQQMFSIRREQGRLGELAGPIRMMLRLDPSAAGQWQPGLAAILAELGMLDEAQRALAQAMSGARSDTVDSATADTPLGLLAEVACATGDLARADTLFEALLPYAELMVGVPGITCYGPGARYLGELGRVLGRRAEASAYFDDAVERARSMGSPVFVARSLLSRARMHAASDHHEDARRDAAESLTTARRVGMAGVEAEALRLAR